MLSWGVEIIESVAGEGKAIGLTFDDGPNPADTPRLLEVLRRYGVKAVFCLVGQCADAFPDLVRAIAADGHVLANHSYRHDHWGEWPAEQVEADLAATNAAIRRAVPGAAIPFFRAPYGEWGVSPLVAAGLGMAALGWSYGIGDWDPPGTGALLRRLLDVAAPGALVLLHDGGASPDVAADRSQTVVAVERAIPVLKEQGYRFVLPKANIGEK